MDQRRSSDIGLLVLRLAVGGLLLLHGISKLRHGFDWMKPMLESKGLPAFISYGVIVGEVLAPILVIVGILSRVGGAIIAFNMAMAVWLAQSGRIFQLGKSGGAAIELELLYLLGGIAIVFLGAGALSVSRGRGRFD